MFLPRRGYIGTPSAGETAALAESRFERQLIVSLLIVAPVLALWPLCHSDFTTWDDPQTVSQNPTLNPPSLRGLLSWWSGHPRPVHPADVHGLGLVGGGRPSAARAGHGHPPQSVRVPQR